MIGLGLPLVGAQHQIKPKAIVSQLIRAQFQEPRQVVGALGGNSINVLVKAHRKHY